MDASNLGSLSVDGSGSPGIRTRSAPTDRVRVAILRDFAEEGWASMDLVAEMLADRLHSEHAREFESQLLCPKFRYRASRVPWIGRSRLAGNVDRYLNRWHTYPRFVARQFEKFDLFHVSDHSYAHLVHALPPDRTTVFCHDLDAFRCLLHPERERRPRWFRRMMRRVLTGLQQAAIVFYSTESVREQILAASLVEPERLVAAPYGTSPEFTPQPHETDAAVASKLTGRAVQPYLLHVGSCIARKRIDVLLDVFAAVRQQQADLQLVQVGGEWTASQLEQLHRLGVQDHVTQVRGIERHQLAALYRRAKLVLQTSEAEGFGLPVIEALACGTAVIASDLSVLREVGGEAAVYCPVGDVPRWSHTVRQTLDGEGTPCVEARLRQARRFSWSNHARVIADTWRSLCSRSRVPSLIGGIHPVPSPLSSAERASEALPQAEELCHVAN